MLLYQQPLHIYKAKIPPSSGNNPTPLKTPDFKGFYSSRFAIDSRMTAKNQDALLFTSKPFSVFLRQPLYHFSSFAVTLMLSGVFEPTNTQALP